MKESTEMITTYAEDYCMDCQEEHSLAICDRYDNCTDVSKILENNNLLSNKELEYIICKKCNREYNIDWSRANRMPVPLSVYNKLDQFIEEFKQNNKYV